MKKNILIVKPNNNIYAKPRPDERKTDLQSGEIHAFTNALLTEALSNNQELYIHHANDMETCINNNMGNAQDRRNMIANVTNPWIKQFFLYGNKDIEANLENEEIDTLVIFCGMFTKDDPKTEDLINLISIFDGQIYYVLNDLRLGIPEKYRQLFFEKDIIILTQAQNYGDVYQRVIQMEFDKLPFWYVDYDKDIPKTYDVCYPVMNFNDVGEGRKNKLKRLAESKDVEKLWIGLGGYNFSESTGFQGFNNQTYPTVKYTDIGRVTKMCKASYIVNEDIYNKHDLIPNRLWECLIVGCIPLIDRETFWALQLPAEVYNELFLSSSVITDDLQNIHGIVSNPTLLWHFQGIGQKLRMNSELRINILRNFKEQINKFLRTNEH